MNRSPATQPTTDRQENGHSALDTEERAFVELLQRPPGDPAAFAEAVAPWLERSFERFFPHLLNAVDASPAETGPLAASLLRQRFASRIPGLLMPLLEQRHLLRFQWASSILVDLRIEEAVPLFRRILEQREKSFVLGAVRSLAALATPSALEGLRAFLLEYPDEVQLSASFRYLVPLADRLGPSLLPRLDALSPDRRAWAIKYLAETGFPEALGVFRTSLVECPLDLGPFAISGLGRIGTVEAVEILVKNGMSQDEWFLRKRTVDALGQCRVPEAIPPLIRALIDGSVQVRTAAVESLSKVGHLDLTQLIGALQTGEQDQKIGLIRALGQIRDKRNVEPLIRTLQDRSTLFFSLDAIGDLGFVEATPALIPFLKDREWFNRLNALESLAKIYAPGLRDLAHDSLEDPNDMVRNAAQRILSQKERPA